VNERVTLWFALSRAFRQLVIDHMTETEAVIILGLAFAAIPLVWFACWLVDHDAPKSRIDRLKKEVLEAQAERDRHQFARSASLELHRHTQAELRETRTALQAAELRCIQLENEVWNLTERANAAETIST